MTAHGGSDRPIAGAFDVVGGLGTLLGAGLGLDLDFIGQQILLSAHNCGDGSLFVDDFDLQEILTNWNDAFVAGTLPDLNGDGFVGIADLNQVLANFIGGTAPAVPEPAIAVVLAVVGACRLRDK